MITLKYKDRNHACMVQLFFDGAAIPNPGRMGIGAVLIKDGKKLSSLSEKLHGIGTNNIAEYSALMAGIKMARERGFSELVIRGDSKLVINQVNGRWKVRNAKLKKLHYNIMIELKGLSGYEIKWVPREKNSIADSLSKKALEEENLASNGNRSGAGSDGPRKDALCPKCGARCVFGWTTFKNGKKHIRQECPKHGYVRWAPRREPFLSYADKRKDRS